MRHMLQLATAALTITALFLGRSTAASADGVDAYPQAMRAFVPVIRGWIDEVEQVAEAAQVKPEILQDEALAELAARGRSIAGDLAGTEAPGTHAQAHAALVEAIDALAGAAETAAHGDPRVFADAVAEPAEAAARSLRRIQSYALRGGPGRIELPDQPASGN